MGVLTSLGRILFVAVFIYAGLYKIQNPTAAGDRFAKGYEGLHKAYLSSIKLPEQLSTKFIAGHKTHIAQAFGAAQILFSVLIILGVRSAAFGLATTILAAVALAYNPLISTGPEQKTNLNHLITSVAQLGICYLIAGCGSGRQCNKVEGEKGSSKHRESKEDRPSSNSGKNNKGKAKRE
jgi:uncharacterized membrane protein YphA (DoxX/SURF4 family)